MQTAGFPNVRLSRRRIEREHLDRNRPLQRSLAGKIDRPHPALPEHPSDFVLVGKCAFKRGALRVVDRRHATLSQRGGALMAEVRFVRIQLLAGGANHVQECSASVGRATSAVAWDFSEVDSSVRPRSDSR